MASQPDEAANKRKHVDYEQKCVEKRGGANETYGRGYPREDTPPAQCSVLCGPRSFSTLPSSLGNQNDGGTSPPEPKRRRLWGLRGLVKMFRRRVRRKGGVDSSESPEASAPTLRARSASELTVDPTNRASSGPYNQGLSVSHDSVFSPESPTEQTHTAPPGLSLATRGVNMSELKAVLRRRRALDSGSVEDDPDDPGLPRSPPTSPTTLDVLNHGLKSSSRGGQSSCSDGSLLSMGSSENDEDSFGVISHHSSKHSLIEGRHQVVDNEPAVGAAPLSHKAARHKISVRPKRTHGVPRARKQSQVLPSSLPTTPEVNEDCSVRGGGGGAALNASFSPPYRPQENQRPSSISFSSIETQMTKSRSEWNEERRSVRKSLPEPSSHPEEKKEEPLLSRLFGSVRSGQQKEVDDSPKESVTSSDDRRASREKRKDPFRTSTGSKSSRQKSDPSRLPYVRETSIQPTERNGSQRSSSVEGRLEGRLEGRIEGRLEGSPFDTYQHSRQHIHQFVGEISTQRERREVVEESHAILRHAVMADRQETTMTRSVATNRLSSSYDSLDNDEMLPEMLALKHSINSLESCEGRSSTDSLTTTPLPGIYIRSNQSLSKARRTSLQNQARESIARWKEDHHHHHYLERDTAAIGPLSLDSSLSVVQHEEEELRKSVSVDEVTAGGESRLGRNFSNDSSRNDLLPVSRPVTILRSVSVHSPTSSSRGSSVRSRKSSIGDELESDSSLPRVSLRKVKREPSLKKPAEETEAEAVPEFMRIQLNRVQSKGNAVIFDTEQNNALAANNKSLIANVKVESMEPAQTCDRKVEINEEPEKPREQSEIIVEEKNPIELNAKKDIVAPFTNQVSETSNAVTKVSATSHPASFKGGTPKGQNEEQSKRKEEKDEIILRRPSVVDRAIVIDQTMSALPSSPVPKKDRDEPELFKVFARRSFKLKDAELEAVIHQEPNGDMDKENHVPPLVRVAVEGEQSTNLNKKSERANDASNSTINTPLPTLKSISSKRYSLGSSTPIFASPADPKPTVIVLSGNNSTPTDSCESKTSSSVKESETGALKTGLKAKEKVLNTSLFERSQSLSPSTPQSKRNSGLEADGNFSSSSEDNVEVNNSLNDSSSRLKKGSSFSKTGLKNYSPSTNLSSGNQVRKGTKKIANKEVLKSNPKDVEAASPPFNSAIIRRSALTASGVASSSPSESSSTDGSQSPNVTSKKPLRGQTVIWPPRNQSSDSLDAFEGSPPVPDTSSSISSSSLTSRSALPHSKIVSSFKESCSPQAHSHDGSESQSSNEEELPQRGTIPAGSVDLRKRPVKESCTEATSLLLAEARNTTFAHSFDSHSNSLALSYLGRSETPLKVDRKGSVDEGRSSIGGSEDWRVLVRQRREDRMKQTKTPEAEEIIIETRPSVSRNSKVLEMANNFQKLRVA